MATEDDVRRIALSLPETTEKPWFGTPGWRVKDKGFLRIRSEAEGGLVVFVSDLGEKEAMLASEPEVFFTTPHYDLPGGPGARRGGRAGRVGRADHRVLAVEGAETGPQGLRRQPVARHASDRRRSSRKRRSAALATRANAAS